RRRVAVSASAQGRARYPNATRSHASRTTLSRSGPRRLEALVPHYRLHDVQVDTLLHHPRRGRVPRHVERVPPHLVLGVRTQLLVAPSGIPCARIGPTEVVHTARIRRTAAHASPPAPTFA